MGASAYFLAALSLACLAFCFKNVAGIFGDLQQLVLPGVPGNHIKAGSSQPKNIVVILVDDQDLVLESPSYMPLLKKYIVDPGTTFNNHFTTVAICCPARVSLWTGKQPHNTNVTDVSPPYGMQPRLLHSALLTSN